MIENNEIAKVNERVFGNLIVGLLVAWLTWYLLALLSRFDLSVIGWPIWFVNCVSIVMGLALIVNILIRVRRDTKFVMTTDPMIQENRNRVHLIIISGVLPIIEIAPIKSSPDLSLVKVIIAFAVFILLYVVIVRLRSYSASQSTQVNKALKPIMGIGVANLIFMLALSVPLFNHMNTLEWVITSQIEASLVTLVGWGCVLFEVGYVWYLRHKAIL